jgi:tripartite-type tricarboxylate transporter receptor subunit TctC
MVIHGLALVAAALTAPAFAQDYPTKPIRLVIPFASGGITDIAGRVFAEKLGALIGQQVVVDNKPGGGSRIGAEIAAKSPADGYTLLLANSSSHATLPVTSKELSYEPTKDFTPIARLFSYSSVLVCNPEFAPRTVKDLVEYAKKHPGSVSHGSAGLGSGNHFMGELFNSLSGVKLLHVPYRSSNQALVDVVAGTTNCSFDGAAKSFIDAGKVRPLAVTGLTRDPRFPNVPTLDESGLKGYQIFTWQALMAPKGLPDALVRKLNQAANAVLQDAGVRQKAAELGLTPIGGSPEQLTALIREDIARYAKIAKDGNLTFE